MPHCPRCHQFVTAQAIACPRCHTSLKAHGHPGITLFRATGQEPLCLTCLYHADDSCTFSKRPDAMDCTLYCDRTQVQPIQPSYTRSFVIKTWFKRHLPWILLCGLLLVSLTIALLR